MYRTTQSCIIPHCHGSYHTVMYHTTQSWIIPHCHGSYHTVMDHTTQSCIIVHSHVSYHTVMHYTAQSCIIPHSHVPYHTVMDHTTQSCIIPHCHGSYHTHNHASHHIIMLHIYITPSHCTITLHAHLWTIPHPQTTLHITSHHTLTLYTRTTPHRRSTLPLICSATQMASSVSLLKCIQTTNRKTYG